MAPTQLNSLTSAGGRPLTPKEQQFVGEFLVDLNATQAAIRAGYSKRTARFIACEVLEKPRVQAALQAAIEARSRRTQVSADRVLLELSRVGFADPRRVLKADGTLLALKEWPDDIAAAVASIEFTSRKGADGVLEQIAKLRFWNKPEALHLIGRHLAMFHDGKDAEVPVPAAHGGRPMRVIFGGRYKPGSTALPAAAAR